MTKINKWMWIMHHFIRPIWSTLFGLCFAIWYAFYYIFSKKAKAKYNLIKTTYLELNSIEEYRKWFIKKYVYKWDGYKGIFDHDNLPIEFYIGFDDCDGMALWTKRKLNKIGIKSAIRIGIKGKKLSSWHYDCAWYINGKWHLFNYGMTIIGKTIEECIDNLEPYFIQEDNISLFVPNETRYWKCLW